MDIKSTLSENLLRLRTAKGLTQSELARAAGISLGTYRNLEKAKTAKPKVPTLLQVSTALGVELMDLLHPVPKLTVVRFRARKKMKRRCQVLAEAALWLEDYLFLEDVLDARQKSRLTAPGAYVAEMEPSPERARVAAERTRKAFKLKEDEPIHDLCGLLEDNGIKLLTMKLESNLFFGLSISGADGGPAIVVNTHPSISVERWIFSATHELGHLLLHREAFDAELEDEDRDEENEADEFASWFLMPGRRFRKEWEDAGGMHLYDRVLKVKRIFRVSYKTVLRRLSDDYGQDYGSIIKRFQQLSIQRTGKTLRRIDEPERLSEVDFMEERLSRLVRRAIENGEITLSRAAEILRISYDEMRKRAVIWRDQAA